MSSSVSLSPHRQRAEVGAPGLLAGLEYLAALTQARGLFDGPGHQLIRGRVLQGAQREQRDQCGRHQGERSGAAFPALIRAGGRVFGSQAARRGREGLRGALHLGELVAAGFAGQQVAGDFRARLAGQELLERERGRMHGFRTSVHTGEFPQPWFVGSGS